MLADYNYMPAYYSFLYCPYASYGQYQETPLMEDSGEQNPELSKRDEEEPMYRRPPFFGPRPPFYGPGPFFGPYPPFYGPRPFYGPVPYPRPGFFGLPFLSGLALGGLLF